MTDTTRRLFLRSLAFGAGGLAASQSLAAGNDGHASGYDVAPASDYLATIPRRTGDPVTFTASLDSAPIKATSGVGLAKSQCVHFRSLPAWPSHIFSSIPVGRGRCIGTIQQSGPTLRMATAR